MAPTSYSIKQMAVNTEIRSLCVNIPLGDPLGHVLGLKAKGTLK